MKNNPNRRMLLFRALAVGILLALAGVMLVIGRGHTVYLDNKPFEYQGEIYRCPYKVVVTVGGVQAAKLYEKERGETAVIGQVLRMNLEITEQKGGEAVTRAFAVRLPYRMDSLILNLPGLLAGLPEDAVIEEFVQSAPAEEEETPPEEGLDGDDGFGALQGDL